MRETPQWESCREHACTTLSSVCRMKASSHLKIHPWKEGGWEILLTYTQEGKRSTKCCLERFFWWRHFQHVCSPFQRKELWLYCDCLTHCWAAPGDEPIIWLTKRTGGREMSQVTNPLFFHSVIYIHFSLSFFSWYTWALVPLYSTVSDTVQAHLHRKALCISNSWATVLTSSFTDLQGDAHADMLECMSPLPPSVLWRREFVHIEHVSKGSKWLLVWMLSFTGSLIRKSLALFVAHCSVVANKGICHTMTALL